MTPEQILVVSGLVVALTQFIKWAGLPDQRGPIAVVALSVIGVAMWAYSYDDSWNRQDLWPYFSSFATVLFNAAGIYGFTRGAPSAVSSFTKPPEGAAQAPTGKM